MVYIISFFLLLIVIALVWQFRSFVFTTFFSIPKIGNESGSLNAYELKYIMAISEAVYEASNVIEIDELHRTVKRWVIARTIQDGFFEAYREGIKALIKFTADIGYKKPFYDLSIIDKKTILYNISSIEINEYRILYFKKEPLKFILFFIRGFLFRKKNRRFFFLQFIIKDLSSAIFSSQLGWHLVGYTTWPGIDIHPLEFTKPLK